MKVDPEWFRFRLRELREERGISREDLAERSGIGEGTIRDLEQGRTHPAWKTVVALAEGLGVSVEAFTTPPADTSARPRGRPRKVSEEPDPE